MFKSSPLDNAANRRQEAMGLCAVGGHRCVDLCFSGSSALSGPGAVQGWERGSLTMGCCYCPGYETHMKWWCRGAAWGSCNVLVQTTGSEQEVKRGRVSIRDHQENRTFTVTLEELRLDDADTYWCGIERAGTDLGDQVKVTVDPGKSVHLCGWVSAGPARSWSLRSVSRDHLLPSRESHPWALEGRLVLGAHGPGPSWVEEPSAAHCPPLHGPAPHTMSQRPATLIHSPPHIRVVAQGSRCHNERPLGWASTVEGSPFSSACFLLLPVGTRPSCAGPCSSDPTCTPSWSLPVVSGSSWANLAPPSAGGWLSAPGGVGTPQNVLTLKCGLMFTGQGCVLSRLRSTDTRPTCLLTAQPSTQVIIIATGRQVSGAAHWLIIILPIVTLSGVREHLGLPVTPQAQHPGSGHGASNSPWALKASVEITASFVCADDSKGLRSGTPFNPRHLGLPDRVCPALRPAPEEMSGQDPRDLLTQCPSHEQDMPQGHLYWALCPLSHTAGSCGRHCPPQSWYLSRDHHDAEMPGMEQLQGSLLCWRQVLKGEELGIRGWDSAPHVCSRPCSCSLSQGVDMCFPGSADLRGPGAVSGLEQGSLTLECHYDPGWETYVKWWCRGAAWHYCEILVKLLDLSRRDHQKDRTFTMTMEELRLGDSDTYWCGIERVGIDFGAQVTVNIYPGVSMCVGLCRACSVLVSSDSCHRRGGLG
ncbi:CMRF35-like molecule 1 [Galemys pyrenaicus]|uniref:CMRF35-like molecule 1 n=1 Tax=Galemys pyrenaicus TaxID=202257 RepID=A0A8J6A0Y9_GALPY|nr:CMRF35-like molecule 1 [Galemys pyrenaicus]